MLPDSDEQGMDGQINWQQIRIAKKVRSGLVSLLVTCAAYTQLSVIYLVYQQSKNL